MNSEFIMRALPGIDFLSSVVLGKSPQPPFSKGEQDLSCHPSDDIERKVHRGEILLSPFEKGGWGDFKYALQVLLCLAFSILYLAHSAQADLDMDILPGFDSYSKLGKWLPIKVTLTSVDADISGEIVVTIQNNRMGDRQIYSVPVNLFGTATKTQYLYVPSQSFRRNLQVKLTDLQGKEILRKDVSLVTVPSSETLILVLSDTGSGLEFLDERSQSVESAKSSWKIHVSYSTLYGQASNSSLPDKWKGYDSVDVIVLGDISINALSVAQRQAIKDWVYNGGRLIVSGGAHSQDLVGTFVEEILPVRINGTLALDAIPALSKQFSRDTSGAPIVVASSELTDGSMAIPAGDNGLPIIAQRDVGDGRVIFLAFDYLDPAFQAWDGKRKLWEKLLPRGTSIRRTRDVDVASLLPDTGSERLPSYQFVGLFLLTYILCFGSLNYFILKRSNKSELMWITMPAVAIAFIIGSLGFTYATKSQAAIVSEFSVVDVYQEMNRARINTNFGLFSPAKVDYKMEFPASDGMFVNRIRTNDRQAIQDDDLKLIEKGAFQMEIPHTKTPSLQLFYGESYVDFSGSVSIELSENSARENIGAVISKLPFDLSDCYIFSNGRHAYVGDLASDGRAQAKFGRTSTGNIYDLYSASDGEKKRFISAMKWELTRGIRGTGIIGWMAGSALKSLVKMDIGEDYKDLGMTLVIVHE